jgi:hypothetical protein
MNHYLRIVVKVVLTIVFGLLSLPPVLFGLYLFNCWFHIRASDVYYVDYPYLPASLLLIGIGAVSILSTLYGAWRRSFYGLLFCFPLAFGLAAIVAIPDAIPHVMRSMMADTNYLSNANSFLRVWYEAHYRFPSNKDEFREAMARGPAAWHYRVQSPPSNSFYSQSGTRLPYEIVVVTNASGPRVNDPSPRPGVVYYCVSTDQQAFWMTMTVLQSDFAPTAKLMTTADRSDAVWVVQAAGKDYPIHQY